MSVARIVVDDQFAEISEQVSAALTGMVGRRLAVADFYRFAAQVEAFYQAQGYPLVQRSRRPAPQWSRPWRRWSAASTWTRRRWSVD